MPKLNIFWSAMMVLLIPTMASCHERSGECVSPDELVSQVSGRFFASLPEIKAAFASRGYSFIMSKPEQATLLPEIKSNDTEMRDVEEGYYLILNRAKDAKVYRFVVYKTPKGYYLQEDIGVKNPYQT
jgi:hypothetical protein